MTDYKLFFKKISGFIFQLITLFVFLLFVWPLSPNYITLLFLVAYLTLKNSVYLHKKENLVKTSLYIMLLSLLSPVDIRKSDYPIKNRIVAYKSSGGYGGPSRELEEQAKRGEIYHETFGCMRTHITEPKWIILY